MMTLNNPAIYIVVPGLVAAASATLICLGGLIHGLWTGK